jgi:hypothetical protein
VTDEKQLVVPMFGHFFTADINSPEGMGQIGPAGSIKV